MTSKGLVRQAEVRPAAHEEAVCTPSRAPAPLCGSCTHFTHIQDLRVCPKSEENLGGEIRAVRKPVSWDTLQELPGDASPRIRQGSMLTCALQPGRMPWLLYQATPGQLSRPRGWCLSVLKVSPSLQPSGVRAVRTCCCGDSAMCPHPAQVQSCDQPDASSLGMPQSGAASQPACDPASDARPNHLCACSYQHPPLLQVWAP